MYYLSQDGYVLVESNHLYIDGTNIYALYPEREDILLARYNSLDAAKEALRQVGEAVADHEEIFSFE